MHHLIIGNGVAGIEAAIALRRRDPQAKISLLSKEHDHFYARTSLMYILCGQLSLKDTEPYGRDLYQRMRFDRLSGQAAQVAAREVVLSDGRRIGFDRLLIAAGSRARPAPWPGSAGPGVHAFVTLQDLARLEAEVRPGARAVVVGGGLIGVEVAEALLSRGMRVTFVIREPWYFPVALDAREAEVVAEHVRHHKVDVRLGQAVREVLRVESGPDSGKLRGVRLGAADNSGASENVPADLLVCAIGVIPDTDFLQKSPVQLGPSGGVVVDAGLRAAPDIWAAGDCAEVAWIDGSRRPEQLWYTARDQGRVAGAAMAGEEISYRRTCWYNSAKFFDIEYTTAGFVPPANDPPRPDLHTWFRAHAGTTQRVLAKGESPDPAKLRVVGFNCLGSRWDHEVFLRWIQERRSLADVVARMAEAQFDEEFTRQFDASEGTCKLD